MVRHVNIVELLLVLEIVACFDVGVELGFHSGFVLLCG